MICRPGAGIPFDDFGAGLGYSIIDLDSGHDATVTNPQQLATILLSIA